ncbi:MAG: RHS repeat-associated core domain-containing protein [Dysgonamonadaceae bacterium]|nr:RHS repeat-associated core domain-containing protein [Dysgonamonadaceae bacterium]
MSITYTDFKKVKTLTEGVKNYTLTYGVDDQRRKSVYKENNATKKTRYYFGDYEEEINNLGNVRKIHYLRGAILIQNNGIDSLLYCYSDMQGSLTVLTNESGSVIDRYAYDPWGKRRNPNNWELPDTRTSFFINRGYTMHEHIDEFGLINMNGRMYDPLTAQFMSPDPYVQAPGNWLNYNRYAYCLNNPFKYTDPTGELFGIDDAIIIACFIIAQNAITRGFQEKFAGGNFREGFGKGILTGIVSAGLGYITQVPGMITNGLLQAGVNVGVNGLSNSLDGQDFFNNWYWSAASGLAVGAYSGYQLADTKGLNYWWGSKIKYGRTQWSFFTSELPYETIDFNVKCGFAKVE